jgi:rhodanese-related sulfurtransferase
MNDMRLWLCRLSIVQCCLLALGCGEAPAQKPLLPVASTEEVLAYLREGKTVVFVDAREPAEFAEEHIPGAINVTLREIESMDPATLADPDLVVAYCLKDFRGFEVAKALNRAGVRNARTLKEQGINGWKAQGLPTFLAGEVSNDEAVSRLNRCARQPDSCVKGPS